MPPHPVLLVGSGLAGLMAARRLHQAGCAFQLPEARNRLGGHILSTNATGGEADDGFDLGSSRFSRYLPDSTSRNPWGFSP